MSRIHAGPHPPTRLAAVHIAHRVRFRIQWLISWSGLFSAFLAASTTAHGRAFPSGVGWPKGATLEVYVQNIDADGANSRQQIVANGIKRWQNELARGYTINVHLGDPPQQAPENLIHFKWADPGTTMGDKKLTRTGALTRIKTDDPKKPTKIVTAEGIFSNQITAGATLANTGMHEFTHALGLADDIYGRVTNTAVQVGGVMAFNERDKKEIATLYGKNQPQNAPNSDQILLSDPPQLPRGRVEMLSDLGGQYDYRVSFEGDETEIVDVVTFFIDPALVTGAVPPAGWLYLDPVEVAALGIDAPYFQDYMDDGFADPAPWEALNYIAFRATEEQYDLSLSNPELNFSIFTSNVETGFINVFAGNEHQQVPGPVPEPSALLLLALGAAGVYSGCTHRRRNHFASVN
jgi:hypothetical protein